MDSRRFYEFLISANRKKRTIGSSSFSFLFYLKKHPKQSMIATTSHLATGEDNPSATFRVTSLYTREAHAEHRQSSTGFRTGRSQARYSVAALLTRTPVPTPSPSPAAPPPPRGEARREHRRSNEASYNLCPRATSRGRNRLRQGAPEQMDERVLRCTRRSSVRSNEASHNLCPRGTRGAEIV